MKTSSNHQTLIQLPNIKGVESIIINCIVIQKKANDAARRKTAKVVQMQAPVVDLKNNLIAV